MAATNSIKQKSCIRETLNLSMCVDSNTNTNENGWKHVKTGENSSNFFELGENGRKQVKKAQKRVKTGKNW